MNPAELAWGTAAYLLSGLSLGLASWALAEALLPRPARLGLRLSATIAGQLALCGILVQALGLLGILTPFGYLAASLVPGLAVLWLWRRRRPHLAFFRRLEQAFRLWMRAPAWGLGWLGALLLLYLAQRFFYLPRDIDALSLHGPMIVEWVQSGRVTLSSFWSYPQIWEYQFVPSFLLLRSDVLVAVPGLLVTLGFVLAIREIAARIGLGGRSGHLLALLIALMPIVWRDPLKSDPAFAFALLLGILAVDRAARDLGGSFWLLQLAVFLVLGTKPSGFLYAGALVAAYLAAMWLASRLRAGHPKLRLHPKALLAGVALTVLFQASAGAVQLWNFYANGNPVHPLRLEILGLPIFPGPADLSGTSLLDNAANAETWRQFLHGGRQIVGEEWPLLPLLLAAALIASAVSALRLFAARKMPRSGEALGLLLPAIALLLWVLFLATPWSAGRSLGDWQYIGSGSSLRYAIAPLALTYLAAAAAARRFLRQRTLSWLLLAASPWLIYGKWGHLDSANDLRAFLGLLAAFLLLAGLDRLFRRRPRAAAMSLPVKMAAAFALALTLLIVHAQKVDRTREKHWVKPYTAMWKHIYGQLPRGTKIGIGDGRASFRYFLYGRRFDNRIVPVDLGSGDNAPIPPDLTYFYAFSPKAEGRQQLIEALEGRGFRVLVLSNDQRGALLARP